jgi:hypothetical protein
MAENMHTRNEIGPGEGYNYLYIIGLMKIPLKQHDRQNTTMA